MFRPAIIPRIIVIEIRLKKKERHAAKSVIGLIRSTQLRLIIVAPYNFSFDPTQPLDEVTRLMFEEQVNASDKTKVDGEKRASTTRPDKNKRDRLLLLLLLAALSCVGRYLNISRERQ